MNAFKCGICGDDWSICIPNTVQGGQINLCKSHSDYLQEAQTQALATLLARYEESK